MRKSILFYLFSIALNLSLHSQNWLWDTTATIHQGNRLVKDNLGHIYSFNFNDTVLTKMSDNGLVIWQKSFPSNLELRSGCCSPDSSVYLLGHFSDQLTLGNTSLNSKGNTDLCLFKLSPAGTILWIQQIGSKADDFGGSIAMHGLNVVITGAAGDTTHFSNYVKNKKILPEFFVGRYFTNGNLDTVIFADVLPIYQDDDGAFGTEVATDYAGNIITIVRFTGLMQIDTSVAQNYKGLYIYKFDNGFKHQWHALISTFHDVAKELTINSQNDIIFSFQSNGNHSSHGQIKKLAAGGGTPTLLYTTLPRYSHGDGGDIQGIDLDTCGNINFTGGNFYWNGPLSTDIGSLFVGQLSPTGNLNWFTLDSTFDYPTGCDIVSLGLNKSFVTLLVDSMQINQKLYYLTQINAIIQATFGIPWNTTPLVNQSICANNKTILKCSTAGVIQWYNNPNASVSLATGNTFTTPPLSAGVYTWYANATTCTMVTGKIPITVTVNPAPIITVSDGTICAGDPFVLNPSPSLTYSYSSINPTVLPLSSTSYTIYGYDVNGCKDTAVCAVQVNPPPSIFIQPSQNPVCNGGIVTVTLSGAQSYSLGNVPVSSPFTLAPTSAVTLMVAATGSNGCSNATFYEQKVGDCTDVTDNNSTPGLTIYPNPSTGLINVSATESGTLVLIDCVGQVVYTEQLKNKTRLDLSTFNNGIYFLCIKTANSKFLQKIIIEK